MKIKKIIFFFFFLFLGEGGGFKSKGFVHVVSDIVNNEGIAKVYTGLSAALFRQLTVFFYFLLFFDFLFLIYIFF